jgi:hypothetical protein
MVLRITAVGAVVLACNLASGAAAASTSLPSWLGLFNPTDPAATTRAAQAPSKGAAAMADNGAERGQTTGCLPSAAAVRKLQPNAWPKWTYGPNRERCWYAGKKPVFAKAPSRRNPLARAHARQPAAEEPAAASEAATTGMRAWDHQNGDPVWQPWVMEYRWDESLRYVDRTRLAP